MASRVYEEILAEAMRKSGGAKRVKQALLLETLVEQKKMSLSNTIALRRADGDEISDTDIRAAEASAEAYVDSLVDDMVRMDLDQLIKYNKRVKKSSKVAGEDVSGLRRSDGTFIKPANLVTILNLTLYKYTQALMGTPRLNNRTGRLAHSGAVTSLVEDKNKKGRVSLYFRYMTYPYAVFEPGSGRPMASEARSPQKLFKDALNDALTDILNRASRDRISIYWRR